MSKGHKFVTGVCNAKVVRRGRPLPTPITSLFPQGDNDFWIVEVINLNYGLASFSFSEYPHTDPKFRVEPLE